VLVDLKSKSQVTIPAALIKKMNLKAGDKFDVTEVEGKILLTPVMMVPKEQAWFFTKEWQQEEAQVEKEIADGKLHTAKNKEELFDDLGLNE
jgi:AbrB family looped-hinge helix DNA binding protein